MLTVANIFGDDTLNREQGLSITCIFQQQNNIMHTHLLALVLKTKQNMILSFDF